MKNRVVLTAMAGAALLISSPALLAAPSAFIRVPVQASFGRPKMVSFNLRNDSTAPIKLKAGDQKMTVEPGKTIALKLAPGTSVVAEEATANYPAGTVLAVAQPQLSDATLVLR